VINSSKQLEFEQFARYIYHKTGIDIANYKNQQLKRRVIALMEKENFSNLTDYYTYLHNYPVRLEEFINKITINVSEFFRDKEIFDELKNKIIPMLYKARPSLPYFKIWSAGCANGAEIYSVGIILDELGYLAKSRLIGTDISSYILEKAKKGLFTDIEAKNINKQRIVIYFKKKDNFYTIIDKIKSRTNFMYHDLLKDDFEERYDLIICRNVIIYFTEEIKKNIYKRFYNALRKGGILFIGGTERIIKPKEFGFHVLSPFFYQKL